MAKVLISCIGTGRIIDKTETSKRKYETAKYAFSETDMIETSFMADALVQHYSIDRVIMIGTVKSMWEEVYRAFCSRNNVEYDDNYALELCQVCEESNSQSALKIPSPEKIENALGKDSKVILIHYGLNADELQENAAKILGIEQYLNKGDELYIDITHSFRSIPFYMMNLLIYLQFVSNKNINIKSVLYGMFEAKQEHSGNTPIVEMTSILNVNNWLVGAYSFKEFGNAQMISKLIERENRRDISKRLSTFSDVMGLGYLDGISKQVSNLNAMKNDTFSPIPNCILPHTISDYIKRFNCKTESEFQFQIAKWYFEHQNYACSYISLLEAILTYVQEICELDFENDVDNSDFAKIVLNVKKNNDKFSLDEINKNKQILIRKQHYSDLCKAAQDINAIRNSIAHQVNNNSAKNSDELINILRNSINLIVPIFNEKKIEKTKHNANKHVLINLSNHPSTDWTETQLAAAGKYGEIRDLPFPQIDPTLSPKQINELATQYLLQVQTIAPPQEAVVHIMGELTLCYQLVHRLKSLGYTCLASTSERKVKDLGNGKKEVTFEFVQFREY